MELRLIDAGRKKIAVIKEVRVITGYNLRKAKELVDKAPVLIPPEDIRVPLTDAVALLREAGASVEASNPTALDKLTAVGFIQDAEVALGDGDLPRARRALRAALQSIGNI